VLGKARTVPPRASTRGLASGTASQNTLGPNSSVTRCSDSPLRAAPGLPRPRSGLRRPVRGRSRPRPSPSAETGTLRPSPARRALVASASVFECQRTSFARTRTQPASAPRPGVCGPAAFNLPGRSIPGLHIFTVASEVKGHRFFFSATLLLGR
jgi:hypothetical protein